VDPANGIDDEVRDVWIVDGRVVAAPDDPGAKADRTIDARGDVVMPGGVDVHCHIAGPKVNAARMLRPEDRPGAPVARETSLEGLRSGTLGSVPSTFTDRLSVRRPRLHDGGRRGDSPPGGPPGASRVPRYPRPRQGFLVLMGNNHAVMDRIREGDAAPEGVRRLAPERGQGYGVKVVNPGGIETWKQARGLISALDDPVESFGSPRGESWSSWHARSTSWACRTRCTCTG
jgi:formylmethanofuran dehydrogenase subunit A